ncbi:MAG TPA: hypothetical protein VMW24_01520, partial [Sedimentisphaerales bacterium]|nr:hypothetical protein [Sedimentisphaerales bacterium]
GLNVRTGYLPWFHRCFSTLASKGFIEEFILEGFGLGSNGTHYALLVNGDFNRYASDLHHVD